MRKVPGPGLDAQCWLWKQQEIKAHAAQWILEFLVHNVKELEALLMSNKSYCAELAHNVSSKNHKPMWESSPAANPSAGLLSKENEHLCY